MADPVAATASLGDYRYSMRKLSDGTYQVERSLIDDPMHNPEELYDWAQLPPQIRTLFMKVQNLAAAM